MRLKSKITTLYYKVVIGIRNIIYYLPLIWNDRQWDYTYNYKFLRVKLEKQREHILKYSYHVNKHNDAQELFVCIQLLKRLEDKSYDDIVFEPRAGMQEIWFIPRIKTETKMSLPKKFEHQDIDLLATYLKKYASGWWY
jgi:hypothetical protein